MRFLSRLFRRPTADERLVAAREFVAAGHADHITLSEFERRFGITEVDDRCQSDYYRPEDPNEVERNRRQLDRFLAGGK